MSSYNRLQDVWEQGVHVPPFHTGMRGPFPYIVLLLVLFVSPTVVLASSSELLGHRALETSVKGDLAAASLLDAANVADGAEVDKGDSEYAPRTATGGIINTIMVFLTIVSFVGNALFLVYVFWLSK